MKSSLYLNYQLRWGKETLFTLKGTKEIKWNKKHCTIIGFTWRFVELKLTKLISAQSACPIINITFGWENIWDVIPTIALDTSLGHWPGLLRSKVMLSWVIRARFSYNAFLHSSLYKNTHHKAWVLVKSARPQSAGSMIVRNIICHFIVRFIGTKLIFTKDSLQ